MSETRPGKTAFAFPGAGIKPCGREAPFFARHERILRPLLDEASQIAGVNLAGELSAGRIDRLADDGNQCFTYAFGAGVCRVLDEAGIRPDLAAGYSFGIYGALVAAGAVSFGDGLRMVRKAFDLMAEGCRGVEAGMAAIVGLGRDDIEALLAGRPGADVHLVITNSDLCHVLSGPAGELARVIEEARGRGAVGTERLEVAVPYHHPMIAGASADFASFLETIPWKTPACPVVSSITQELLTRPPQLIDFAARNLSTPISWQGVVEKLAAEGVSRIIECGPGISLSQNGRFLPGGIEYVNLRTMEKRIGP